MTRNQRGREASGGESVGSSATSAAPGKRARTDGLVQRSGSGLPTGALSGDVPSTDAPAPVSGGAAAPPPPVAPDPFDWRAISGPLVQRSGHAVGADAVHAAAASGIATPASTLPHQRELAASFGPAHDLGGIRAHVGGAAAASAETMGATAYATGHDVVLPESPSLHLVAHEVTHVVQQRGGVHLAGGVGEAGDPFEQEADAVADAVVRGEYVGDRLAASGASEASVQRSVQRKDPEEGAAQLWGWVEPQLTAFLLLPVAEDDAKAAKLRVDLILGTVKALHRPQRKLLLDRLAHPKPGDALAELFTHQLSRYSRKRILAVLRDETPAHTEEPEEKKAERGDADASASEGGELGSGTSAATGSNAMWRQVIGEKSSPVGKMARVRAPKGLRLRTRPAAGESDVGIMPFDELVQVERRTEHGWCWVVSMGSQTGKTGFCEEQFLSLDPPEPTAHLYRVQAGDTLGAIASTYYGKNFRGGNDARLYVQALYEANKEHKGVYLEKVDLDLGDTWHRRESEEHTLEIYKGAKVREGLAIWVPSEAFIQALKASGAITSGTSEISKAWRKAKEFVDDAIEAVKYAAGFIVGLLEGAWDAIVDLFEGAADMIEAVAKVLYHLVTGNPGAIKDMLMGWVNKLKLAWANRDKIADEFMKKWEAEDGWDRGRFQGEVLGWVMMTALITIVTMGEATAPMVAGKWGTVLKALKTVDALGDVTTYAGKVGRLPGKAYDVVKGKLGKGAATVEDVVEDAAGAGGKAARGVSNAGEAGDAAGDAAKRGKKGNRPELENETTSLDGRMYANDIRKMSPEARHVIRQMETRGWVRVAEISPEDLIDVSKWFGKEVAVVQSPYGKLRVVLGTEDGILAGQIRHGEVFVVHTHPVALTKSEHFAVDLPAAGKHTEAVIDWSGQITYYNKMGLKNPVRPDGTLEPLRGYQAAFLDDRGVIVGFGKIDMFETPSGTTIKVRE